MAVIISWIVCAILYAIFWRLFWHYWPPPRRDPHRHTWGPWSPPDKSLYYWQQSRTCEDPFCNMVEIRRIGI